MTDWTPPEWLVEWRQQKREIDLDAIPRALEPFGVVRKTTYELAKSLEPAVVYVFVSGTAAERMRASRRITKKSGSLITYSASMKEAESHDKFLKSAMAWSVIRADTSIAISHGKPVVVDAQLTSRSDLSEFARYCFISGARGVVALCLTTEYEEDWDDDGLSGVIWLS